MMGRREAAPARRRTAANARRALTFGSVYQGVGGRDSRSFRCARLRLVPRTRSSHSHAASPIAEFGFKRGTGSIDLPVSLWFRSSHEGVQQGIENFEIGTLGRVLICGRPARCKRFLKKFGT